MLCALMFMNGIYCFELSVLVVYALPGSSTLYWRGKMNLKSLRKFIAVCLFAVAGHGWATTSLPNVTLPTNSTQNWNDISSIVWSTDGGTSWGNSALTVGQSVTFQFTLHKYLDGQHYADFMKTWIDWNNDGQFSASENLLFGANVVNSSPLYDADKVVNQSIKFTSSAVTLTNAMLGSHYLLARVTCSESLLSAAGISASKQWNAAYTSGNNAGYNNLFASTTTYNQGESELRTLTINGQKVPEPGTLALFAVGMVGLGFGRKRMTRV
jgi:hypothetical protein